jgi:Na+/proline symporter
MKAKSSSFDYLLAGQDVKPWLVALSAVATNNSGYMFIGMIGYTYLSGLSSIWLMVGWIMGDLVGSLFIHKHLRTFSEKRSANSFGTVVSTWLGKNYPTLRTLAGILIVFFLGTYAAAQLVAGSKALNVIIGWPMWVGSVMGAIIVVIYCFSGGIRASIWTDAAQSIVMIVSMGLLLIFAIDNQGGLDATWEKLHQLQQLRGDYSPIESSNYMNWFETTTRLDSFWDPILFVIGWFFAGLGVVGQPHIMIRFMAVDKPENIRKVRRYYYSWFVAFYLMTIGAGLLSR